MADIAGFGFYIGDLVHFVGLVGKLDLPFLVVDSDILDIPLPSDVHRNLVDVVAGVEHHRVVGAELDGVGQPVGPLDDFVHEFFLLVIDVEVSPGRNRQQQRQAHGQDELGDQSMMKIFDDINHTKAGLTRNPN